jgi:hypothetical protein
MKKTLLALALLAAGTARAQITFEHKYPQKVNVFKLSTGEVKYATYVSGTANQVRVYNQNHSLFRQLSVPLAATVKADVDYLSDNLFNTTPDLEFLLYAYDPAQSSYQDVAQVFSETGTSLLRVDSTNFVDIYNSVGGTKLVTYQRNASGDYYSKVYALGGTRAALKTLDAAGRETARPYPNPASERVQLPYTIGAGQVGELSITDATGRVRARYQVDATFDHLLFDTRGLRPGVYIYRVQVAGQASAAQRFSVR